MRQAVYLGRSITRYTIPIPQPGMTDSSRALLNECLQLMAAAPDASQGIAAVLERIGRLDGVRTVELQPSAEPEVAGAAGLAPATAEAGPDEGAAAAGAHGLDSYAQVGFRVAAAGEVVAWLRVGYDPHRFDPTPWAMESIADLCAVALSREAALQAMERVLTRHLREAALNQVFIERIIDSLPVSLYVVDRDYRIQVWNHTRESGAQGVAREEAIGRTIFDVMHRQPADRLRAEFDEVFASGRLQQFHMETEAFGRPRLYRISKIPMRLDGETVSHVITVGEDITDWQAAMNRTAQAEKLAALGQLAAGVMHEINNPLATIAACVETMALALPAEDPAPGGMGSRNLVRIIELEVERCKKIVNGLLDFSRPKATAHEPIDLSETADRALFLLQHHPRFKRTQVMATLAPVGTIRVTGSADQLVQVLIALVMNALDVTPDGGRVLVRTRTEVDTHGILRAILEVEDEGPGIPRALQAKIFEPFFTTKPVGQGTGLGLAICYGIIGDHGGTIQLVPSDGSGAHFRVILPLHGVAAAVVA